MNPVGPSYQSASPSTTAPNDRSSQSDPSGVTSSDRNPTPDLIGRSSYSIRPHSPVKHPYNNTPTLTPAPSRPSTSPVFRVPMQLQLPERKRQRLEDHESNSKRSGVGKAGALVGGVAGAVSDGQEKRDGSTNGDKEDSTGDGIKVDTGKDKLNLGREDGPLVTLHDHLPHPEPVRMNAQGNNGDPSPNSKPSASSERQDTPTSKQHVQSSVSMAYQGMHATQSQLQGQQGGQQPSTPQIQERGGPQTQAGPQGQGQGQKQAQGQASGSGGPSPRSQGPVPGRNMNVGYAQNNPGQGQAAPQGQSQDQTTGRGQYQQQPQLPFHQQQQQQQLQQDRQQSQSQSQQPQANTRPQQSSHIQTSSTSSNQSPFSSNTPTQLQQRFGIASGSQYSPNPSGQSYTNQSFSSQQNTPLLPSPSSSTFQHNYTRNPTPSGSSYADRNPPIQRLANGLPSNGANAGPSNQGPSQAQSQRRNTESNPQTAINASFPFPRDPTPSTGKAYNPPAPSGFTPRPGQNPKQNLEPSWSAMAESIDGRGTSGQGSTSRMEYENIGSGSGSGSGSGRGSQGAGQTPGGPDAETFEFMKRKKWPQLLVQELIGAAVWCLVPYDISNASAVASIPCRDPSNRSGWKVVFATPATLELLGYTPEELEGRDWADVISPVDLTRLVNTISNTISPKSDSPGASSTSATPMQRYQLSASRTSTYGAFEYPAYGTPTPTVGQFSGPAQAISVFSRMVNKGGKDVLFELKGHAYFGDEDTTEDLNSPEGNGGFDGGGVMGVPSSSRQFPHALSSRRVSSSRSVGGIPSRGEDEKPCRAFWVMGRKWTGQGDGGGKMLDTFLELKLENEKLKQELRDIQMGGKGFGHTSPAPPGNSRHSQHNAFSSASALPPAKRSLTDSDSESDAETYDEDEDDEAANDTSPPQFTTQSRMDQPMRQDYHMPTQGSHPLPNYGNGQAGPSAYGQQQQSPMQQSHFQPGQQNVRSGADSTEKKPKLSKEEKKARKEAAAEGKEKKPKKLKAKPEYLCRNCGRNDSPEWRKGPLGPKTLCNACGLRWAKRNGILPGVKRTKKDKDDDEDGTDDNFGGGAGGGEIGNYGPGWDPFADQKALGI